MTRLSKSSPPKVGITSSGRSLEDTFVNGEEGDIESSTTEIVDNDLGLLAPLVKTADDGSSGGLVGDTEILETDNGAGILGGLALSVVEVGGDGNDGWVTFAEVSLGGLLHLDQDHGGDFIRSEIPLLATMVDQDGGLESRIEAREPRCRGT